MQTEIMTTITSFLRTAVLTALSFILNSIVSIDHFLTVILILACLDIVFGWLEDEKGWNFKKACNAGLYFGGYVSLLILVNVIGRLMKVDDISYYCSWITWVMTYFYGVNIMRNWKNIQTENKVIAFLYWVLTVKFIRNINFLEDYINDKTKDTETDTTVKQ